MHAPAISVGRERCKESRSIQRAREIRKYLREYDAQGLILVPSIISQDIFEEYVQTLSRSGVQTTQRNG